MAYQLQLKNVTNYLTEITPERSRYGITRQNKDESFANRSVFLNRENDGKTFDWVFRHIQRDGEAKRIFEIKGLKVDEVIGLDNGTFTAKLSQNQDFTIEYPTYDKDTGHLDFSISSIL